MPIPVFFSRYGEAAFRDLEAQVLQDLGKGSGQVIATGGGCVTREKTTYPYGKMGKIIWIQRPLNLLLSIQGRPLCHRKWAWKSFQSPPEPVCPLLPAAPSPMPVHLKRSSNKFWR